MARYIQRYNAQERSNHWGVALMFVLAGLSGLAFFHPSLFFLSNLFGGGAWARILHPFLGVVMFLLFMGMFFRFKNDNKMTDADREWNKHRGELLRGDKSKMPPVGKYNAGQKMVFWVTVWSLFLLLATGLMFWRPWFAGYFPIDVVRAAALVHAISAVVLILSIIVHVYAAIWVKGSVRAMTRGTVSEEWAKQNHALWYQQQISQGK
jgi:formate dehydrogenase subunit gamma